MLLFLRSQIGQLDGRVEGYLLLIDHVQKLRDQVGETDIPVDLISTFSSFLTDDIEGLQLHPNLG